MSLEHYFDKISFSIKLTFG